MDLIFGLIILLFSAIIHEIAHGFVADRLGDPTARLMGRLTLNPIKHIDPFMSILLPLILLLSGSPIIFGAAKPVPVDPFNLRDGRKDLALVSLAGPLTNVVIAILTSIIIKIILPFLPIEIMHILGMVVIYNLILAIFNLLPIPPLDGSKVFSLLLPERQAAAYLSLSQFGFLILFILLMFPIRGLSLQGVIMQLLGFSLQLLGMPVL